MNQVHNKTTVKPKVFEHPLFREFLDLGDFVRKK